MESLGGFVGSGRPRFESINNGFDFYSNSIVTPAPLFGTNVGHLTSASSLSGDTIGFFESGELLVPAGYTSGSQIIGSMTFAGMTFAQLGLLQGTYVYNLTNGLDNITLNIPSEVPEPSTLGLIGLGLLGLGAMKRRRRDSWQPHPISCRGSHNRGSQQQR
jgi:PEP-CTERM motif